MAPVDLQPLPVVVSPREFESASGFILRAARSNGMRTSGIHAALGLPARRTLGRSEIPLLAGLTQASPSWFEWRMPDIVWRDGYRELRLFGQAWNADWSLRRSRQQMCHECLRSEGLSQYVWDLTLYCACPDHGILLQDHCGHCGQSLQVNRPSWDVCNCRHYLVTVGSRPPAASQEVLDWCRWISHALNPAEHPSPHLPRPLANFLSGMSVDGASRILLAFAGGTRVLSSTRQHAVQPWLPTAAIAEIVHQGMRQLTAFTQTNSQSSALPVVGVEDILRMAALGHTEVDRARAAWVLRRLKGHRAPLRRHRDLDVQPDLFSDLETA
ncbi:TniQ family protein [Piscinibacter gummiphilus]|uniref:TniQ family protein n=1 Tax=Piscinibacter gummiphilus TaxID=946333 RepID=UPI0039B9C8DE